VYTNSYFSVNSNERLKCVVTPTPYKEYQDMSVTNFYGTWIRNCGSAGIVEMTASDTHDGNVARFSVPVAKTNVLYKGALIRNLKDSWLNNTLGYLYTLDVEAGDLTAGFSKIRLYLVGAPDSLEQAADFNINYEVELKKHSWVMMELLYEVSGKANKPVINTVRNLYLWRPEFSQWMPVAPDMLSGNPEGKASDLITNPGGLLLSGPNMAGFATSSSGDYAFSYPAIVLSKYGLDTNEFKNIWVVIENEFAKLEVVEAPPIKGKNVFLVTVDTFSVKQPTTYSLSVYNDALTTPPQVATWIFQTAFSDRNGEHFQTGKQCLLDTVGKEPCSLKRERQGLEAQ